jgi:hypothetical protein
MLCEALTAAFLVLPQVATSSATADSQHRLSSPRSSAAEVSTVASNEMLRQFIDADLWLERDAITGRNAKDAAFEWPELLRRVGYQKPAGSNKQSGGRSAKGSVELLESLKKARKEKGGGK